MRVTLLSLVVVMGCGSSTPMPANHVRSPVVVPTPAGTSGMAGLDWGASAETVRAVSPTATPNQTGGLSVTGNIDGRSAITSFVLGAHGLEGIAIEWPAGFLSMGDCATHWKELRAKYDGRFGGSTSDNLAAYWKTPSARITLACNPTDDGTAALSMIYAKPDQD